MADEGKDGGRELFNERERQALQELAEAIVREASVQENLNREAMKIYLDMSKHLTTLAGAVAVVMLILYQALDLNFVTTALKLQALVVSFMAALVALLMATEALDAGNPSAGYVRYQRRLNEVSILALGGGVWGPVGATILLGW